MWQIKDSTRKKLEAGKDSAYLSKQIAEIWCDAPVKLDLPALDVTDLDVDKLKAVLTQLEFRSLLKNLPQYMQVTEINKPTASKPLINPAKIKKLDDAAKVNLTMAPAVAAVIQNETNLLVSPKSGEAYIVAINLAAAVLKDTALIAHDSKLLLKKLLDAGTKAGSLPKIAHDTEQAAFLLDPLSKFRELSELSGNNIDDPLVAVEALWQLYSEQGKELERRPKLALVARNIDFALIPLLAEIEHRGILLDSPYLLTMGEQLGKRIETMQQQIFDLIGYDFNIASPAQLADVLYGKLALSTIGIKRAKPVLAPAKKSLINYEVYTQ